MVNKITKNKKQSRKRKMIFEKQKGIPKFECMEYQKKTKDYVVLIPIINEGERISKELKKSINIQASQILFFRTTIS